MDNLPFNHSRWLTRAFASLAIDQSRDALHWIRQVLALVCGLLWGSIPLVEGIWIVLLVLDENCSYCDWDTSLVRT
ncbi:hypothetical protein EUGRSUZ_H02119 [Eucalyptus grandis]|uniref:Uncharacterized protein n=4 Tax=Eucalyptus grandis TaxID=71139 RepID=A0A059B174_EUCGR|nr:hypothetical protein EUGRSUZ_H02119 [Eucalyptus grandis]KAK3416399.1 hypothetical protein EUGRSUZ_H02119 [Eucalyptus grandis]KAK3416400.1 hypothetical protein EUGRSUZ_H02119 [Eucalyptus grandis]